MIDDDDDGAANQSLAILGNRELGIRNPAPPGGGWKAVESGSRDKQISIARGKMLEPATWVCPTGGQAGRQAGLVGRLRPGNRDRAQCTASRLKEVAVYVGEERTTSGGQERAAKPKKKEKKGKKDRPVGDGLPQHVGGGDVVGAARPAVLVTTAVIGGAEGDCAQRRHRARALEAQLAGQQRC
jgi:hypothetical protein